MNIKDFHHALRIMRNIGRSELKKNGIVLDDKEWFHFQSNPYDWFIRANDVDCAYLWRMIENRMKGE